MRRSVLRAMSVSTTLAMAMMSAGCSSSGDGSSPATQRPQPAPAASETPAAGETAASGGVAPPTAGDAVGSTVPAGSEFDPLDPPGPLEQLQANLTPTAEEARAAHLEQERIVAECMHESGWEYTPVPFPEVPPPSEAPPGTVGYAARYGYGVVRNYEFGSSDTPVAYPTFLDTNQAYLDTLSKADREAWMIAFAGSTEPMGRRALSQPPSTEVPCGQRGLNASSAGDIRATNADFRARLFDLAGTLDEDPRIVEASKAWSGCMFAEFGPIEILGRPVLGVDDAAAYMESLVWLAQGLEVLPADLQQPQTGMVGVVRVLADGTPFAAFGVPQKIEPETFKRLQATELELFAADRACQQQAGIHSVRDDVEQEAVDALRAEFPDLELD